MPATAEGVLVGAKNILKGVIERKELTTWSRVLLEKLKDAQLVQGIFARFMEPQGSVQHS